MDLLNHQDRHTVISQFRQSCRRERNPKPIALCDRFARFTQRNQTIGPSRVLAKPASVDHNGLAVHRTDQPGRYRWSPLLDYRVGGRSNGLTGHRLDKTECSIRLGDKVEELVDGRRDDAENVGGWT